MRPLGMRVDRYLNAPACDRTTGAARSRSLCGCGAASSGSAMGCVSARSIWPIDRAQARTRFDRRGPANVLTEVRRGLLGGR
jgi:hypothetical protein